MTVLNNLKLIKKVHLNLWQLWFSFEHRDHYFEPFGFCFRIRSSVLLIIPIFIETIGWSLHWAIWKLLKLLNDTVFNNLLSFKQTAHHYFWKFWFCWEHRQSFVWTIWILFKPWNDHCLQQFWINLKKQFIKIFNNSNFIKTIGWSLHWSIWILLKQFNDTVFNNLLSFKQSAHHCFKQF